MEKLQPSIKHSVEYSEGNHYTSYIQNYWVDVPTGQCHVETLSIENGAKSFTFPVTKRYDREALTRLLYAASIDYNSDYISEDHVEALVTNAIDSIWTGMRKHGIRKLRQKVGVRK
jgi:hypothetical protein